METTPNFKLPFILAAQAQKHVTHNEALQTLDALIQLAVETRALAAPPAAPSAGQRFLIAEAASGAWQGHSHHVALWQDDGWSFFAPQEGWLCYVHDERRLVVWTGTAWTSLDALTTTLNNLSRLGVGTEADATNLFSAKLNNVLWTARTTGEGGDGDLRYKMNKEASGKTLSLLMQTAYAGRAEIGLTGDDKLHIKVSANGASWSEALVIDPATGFVGLGTTTPSCRLDATGAVRVASYSRAALPSAAGCGAGAIIHVGDESGGAVLAFSDGGSWRRVTDRAVVS